MISGTGFQPVFMLMTQNPEGQATGTLHGATHPQRRATPPLVGVRRTRRARINEQIERALPGLRLGDRSKAYVFAENYGQVGAIEYFSRELDLPPVISGYNAYWMWGPGSCDGDVIIAIGGTYNNYLPLFASIERAATHYCIDCMPYENNKPIWILRGLELPMNELWSLTKHYD